MASLKLCDHPMKAKEHSFSAHLISLEGSAPALQLVNPRLLGHEFDSHLGQAFSYSIVLLSKHMSACKSLGTVSSKGHKTWF